MLPLVSTNKRRSSILTFVTFVTVVTVVGLSAPSQSCCHHVRISRINNEPLLNLLRSLLRIRPLQLRIPSRPCRCLPATLSHSKPARFLHESPTDLELDPSSSSHREALPFKTPSQEVPGRMQELQGAQGQMRRGSPNMSILQAAQGRVRLP